MLKRKEGEREREAILLMILSEDCMLLGRQAMWWMVRT